MAGMKRDPRCLARLGTSAETFGDDVAHVNPLDDDPQEMLWRLHFEQLWASDPSQETPAEGDSNGIWSRTVPPGV